MFPRTIFLLLVLAAALALGGCATSLTWSKIEPGDDKRDADYPSEVTAAYRDANGNVTVCVNGREAGAFFFDTQFALSFPAAASPQFDRDAGTHRMIPEYRVTAADVHGGCPGKLDGLLELPVLVVRAKDFGNADYAGMSDKALAEFFEHRARAPAIYMFYYRPFSSDPTLLFKLVYVSEKTAHDPVRAVEIATRERQLKPQPAFIAALPFAAVFDLVMFPFEILAFMITHG